MSGNDYLYLIFSETNTNIAKIIRKATKYKYNHVSIALSDEPQTFYSFARRYEKAPFYGGFVSESYFRYYTGEKPTSIRVFAIPISYSKKKKVIEKIEEMKELGEEYVYNLISACLTPFQKKIPLSKAYTCVEFATLILNLCEVIPDKNKDKFYSIKDLNKLLKHYIIYEGLADEFLPTLEFSGEDSYFFPQPLNEMARKTITSNFKMLKLFINERIIKK